MISDIEVTPIPVVTPITEVISTADSHCFSEKFIHKLLLNDIISGPSTKKAIQDFIQNKNVNVKLHHDWTALLFAAGNGDTESVEFLIERKADTDARTKEGATALIAAIDCGHTETAKSLLPHSNLESETNEGLTALIYAAYKGQTEILELLITKGAKIEKRTGKNLKYMTALHFAAHYDQIETLELLLNRGANIDVCDMCNETPLIQAIWNNNTACAKLLINIGADANIGNREGATALMTAVHRNNEKIVESLINNSNADLNLSNIDGTTALRFAEIKGNTKIVNLLLRAIADVNLRNHEGGKQL